MRAAVQPAADTWTSLADQEMGRFGMGFSELIAEGFVAGCISMLSKNMLGGRSSVELNHRVEDVLERDGGFGDVGLSIQDRLRNAWEVGAVFLSIYDN